MCKPEILILGSGASARFAVKAAIDFGIGLHTMVMSTTPFSTPPGAFWFHWVPDDIAEKVKSTEITIHAEGTAKQYQRLQWNINPCGIPSSFPKVAKQIIYGYNPAETAAWMKPLFFLKLHESLADEDIEELCSDYDLVFQTFPTKISKEYQPALQFYYMGIAKDAADPNENYVIYNGSDNNRIWCRKAALWGNIYYEFPKRLELEPLREVMDRRAETENLEYVRLQDLDPFTDPWMLPYNAPKNLHLVGRWAEWNTKRLSHEAYSKVMRILNQWEKK